MRLPYLEYFGLLEEPYSPSPNPRYFYLSPTHNLALQKTELSIMAKYGLSFCFGAVGMGKSTLARELTQRLENDPTVSYVFITNPNFPTPNQLLRAIVQEFRIPQTSKKYFDLLNIVKQHLSKVALQERKTLALLIDEAQTLKSPLLEMLRQLMNFESNDEKYLQVILFAQEEFRQKLSHPRYRNLVNRAPIASSLDPFSPAETEAMLKFRWMVAGGKTFPFTLDAIEAIYRFSQGIPRTQVILANNALLAAFLLQTNVIDNGIIYQVVKDRGLPDTQPLAAQTIKKHTAGQTTVRRTA
jgi:general secretion pathway protein A